MNTVITAFIVTFVVCGAYIAYMDYARGRAIPKGWQPKKRK